MGELVKLLLLVALLTLVTWVGASARFFKQPERFRVYTPGATDYTSAQVQTDPCPFADDDVVRQVAFAGPGLPKCAGAYTGLNLPFAYYDDHGDVGVSAFCLEVPGENVSNSALYAVLTSAAPYVVPLRASTIKDLLAAADAAAAKTQTTCAPLLLVAQKGGYGGTTLTSTRADGFDYAASGGTTPSDAVLEGMLAIVPSVDGRVALEAALTRQFGSNSALCNMSCAGDATKRCGCLSTMNPSTADGRLNTGNQCMATKVDYAHFGLADNRSIYWVAYRMSQH